MSRQKDVKKISELIYLELTVRMLPVFEIVQFENSPLQKLYRENEYKFSNRLGGHPNWSMVFKATMNQS